MTFVKVAVFLILAVIFCIFVLLGVVFSVDTVAAEGIFDMASGTESDPYVINSVAELQQLATSVNNGDADGYAGKHFVLGNNIDATDGCVGVGGWTPIGNWDNKFNGHFNGAGYAILNLTIIRSDDANMGLFGAVEENAVIDNLTVSGNIIGKDKTGGIVGENFGLIKNCINQVNLTFAKDSPALNVGGITGYNEGTVDGCENIGKIDGNFNCVGGIVGGNYGTILNSSNSAGLKSTSSSVGGIVGVNFGQIYDSYNTGTVLGEANYVGGISGNNVGLIEDSFNVSAISSMSSYAGGIAGINSSSSAMLNGVFSSGTISAFNLSGGINGYNLGTVQNAYNSGMVIASGNGSRAGGIVAENWGGGLILNTYNISSNITGVSYSGAVCGYNLGDIANSFSSSDKFEGEGIGGGADTLSGFTNLNDVDMTNNDTLFDIGVRPSLALLTSGVGAEKWGKENTYTKRDASDSYCYTPELRTFIENSDVEVNDLSKNSVAIRRVELTDNSDISITPTKFTYTGEECVPELTMHIRLNCVLQIRRLIQITTLSRKQNFTI